MIDPIEPIDLNHRAFYSFQEVFGKSKVALTRSFGPWLDP